jgi:hypothetical protein
LRILQKCAKISGIFVDNQYKSAQKYFFSSAKALATEEEQVQFLKSMISIKISHFFPSGKFYRPKQLIINTRMGNFILSEVGNLYSPCPLSISIY